MSIRIGAAPCSWGVEFAGDPRNPDWRVMLREAAEAGYRGVELGPVGYMPEDPPQVAEALSEHGLELIGGVVFRPFHDPAQWEDVLDGGDPHLSGAEGPRGAASGADRLHLRTPRPHRGPGRGRRGRWTPANGPPIATASSESRAWARRTTA